MEVVQDLITYLKGIDKMAKTLSPTQKKKLETILSSVLTLLVCMKQSSNLGKVKFDWENITVWPSR